MVPHGRLARQEGASSPADTRAPLGYGDPFTGSDDGGEGRVARRGEHGDEATVGPHPPDVDVGEAGCRGSRAGAGRGEQDGAGVLRERGELGVEAVDEEGPLHRDDRATGDDEHHGERADHDVEAPAQRHQGSRTV